MFGRLTIGKLSGYKFGNKSDGASMQTESLVRLAEIFADQMGLRLSTVSTYAANDGKWIDGLKGGASCTLRKASDVLAWFSVNWPEDLEWPRDIPRPTPKPKEAA